MKKISTTAAWLIVLKAFTCKYSLPAGWVSIEDDPHQDEIDQSGKDFSEVASDEVEKQTVQSFFTQSSLGNVLQRVERFQKVVLIIMVNPKLDG